MARVVQRRTPPYLLIVFVILFVFATVLAVLFFNKFTGFEEKYAKTRSLLRQVASDEEIRADEVRQMLNVYKDTPRGEVPKTVVSQLTGQVGELAYIIKGLPNTTFSEARHEAEKTFKDVAPPVRQGLAKHMTDFHQQLGVKDAELTKLKADVAQLDTQLKQGKQALADQKTDFETKLAAKDTQIESLDQKFQNFETAQNKKLADAKKDYADSVAELSKQIAEQASKLQTVQREVVKWQKKYANVIGEKPGRVIDPMKVVRRPDGRIKQVLAQDGLVYIDIGRKDRVTEDLRLTVYPYTGIPDSGVGKAIIEVTNVSDNVSECRIIQQDKDKPIVAGDLVANVVYDGLRTYNFVVEGEFDVDNTGVPTMAGNKAIRDMVRRYGGQVMKDVTLDADYLILGDAPSRPRKPDDTDGQDIWDLYQARLKSFNRYQEIKRVAEGLQVPRLGGKRFLDLIGYIPAKPAKQP